MAQPSGGRGKALDADVEVGPAAQADEATVTAAELDDARRHQAAVDRKVAKLQAHLSGAQAASVAAAARVDAATTAHKQSSGRGR
jgi:hypothetical protein